MKIADILNLVISKIRSGNADTRAVDAREVFNNIATSYINKDDFPQFVETISASGPANNYIAAYAQPITAYAEGVVYKVNFPANTGPATININNLGQKAIKRANGEDLSANDLQGVVMLVYRSNVFQLIGGQSINENEFVKKTGDETIDGIKTFEEIPVLPDADPEADNEATRKKYVDNIAEAIAESISSIVEELEGQIAAVAAIKREYATTATMIAGRVPDEQEAGELFFVSENGFYYEYLGTATGTIADYRIQSNGDVRSKALEVTGRWTFSSGVIMEYIYGLANRIRARFRDVMNAVNYITIGNSVTGQNPYISAADSVDANRGIDIRAKGNAKHNITGLYYNTQSAVERVISLLNGDVNAEYEIKNGGILADVPDTEGVRLDDNDNWDIGLYNFETCDREGPKGAISSDSDYVYFAIEDNTWLRINVNRADSGLALGETSATAYRGDRGKTAYDHSQETGNPHETGIGDIENLTTELSDRYTKLEVDGLLEDKVDVVAGSRLISSAEVNKLGTIEEGAQVNPTDVSELNNDANYLVGNAAIAPGTATKVTYDSKGLVTGGENLAASDIPNLPASKITSGTNTAFNKDFGTTAGTVAEGNHNHNGVYEPVVSAGATGEYYRGDKTWQTLDKSAVGLGDVDNTADMDKPVSNAVKEELDVRPFDIVRDYTKVANTTNLDEDLFSITLYTSAIYSTYVEFEGNTVASGVALKININGNTEFAQLLSSSTFFKATIEIYSVVGDTHMIMKIYAGSTLYSRVFESSISAGDPVIVALNVGANIGDAVLRKRLVQKANLV